MDFYALKTIKIEYLICSQKCENMKQICKKKMFNWVI